MFGLAGCKRARAIADHKIISTKIAAWLCVMVTQKKKNKKKHRMDKFVIIVSDDRLGVLFCMRVCVCVTDLFFFRIFLFSSVQRPNYPFEGFHNNKSMQHGPFSDGISRLVAHRSMNSK